MALDNKDQEVKRLAAQNADLIADLKNARDDLKKLRAELTAQFQKIIDELKLKIKQLEDLLREERASHAKQIDLLSKQLQLMDKKNLEMHQNEIKNIKDKNKVVIDALNSQHAEVIRRLENEIMMLKQRPEPIQVKSHNNVEVEMHEGGQKEPQVDYAKIYKMKERELTDEVDRLRESY